MRSNIVVALALLATVGPALSGPIASPATVSSDACTVAASRNDIVDSGATQLGRPLPAFSTFDSQTFCRRGKCGEFAELLPRGAWMSKMGKAGPPAGEEESQTSDHINTLRETLRLHQEVSEAHQATLERQRRLRDGLFAYQRILDATLGVLGRNLTPEEHADLIRPPPSYPEATGSNRLP
ncbi:hypothetical protein BC835DRAFT_1320316 [Cytidiella melzeri]|nr:hypothetical protein BC835DRAFT_1320316 [Cytidiella melzeri]